MMRKSADVKRIHFLKQTQVKYPKKLNQSIFERNVPGITGILKKKKVGIAGLGGVGSNVAVSLVRSGIGSLVIADFDRVEVSNLNRQHYFLDDVGKRKVDALARQLRNINPELILCLHAGKLDQNNIISVFKEVDLLIEAFDKAEDKSWLIEKWCENFPGKPVICASGLGGYGNTESLKVMKSGNIYICGDGQSEMSLGLSASRVAIVANMQANTAVELLVGRDMKR